jgi:hypothetical protein
MEYARLATAKLKDVTGAYYFAACCKKCGHRARLNLVKLRAHLGDEFPVVKIRERLRCDACRSRNVTTTFLSPASGGSSLAHLFAEKPR